jgi:DNA-binding response OmpR family regulator
MTNPVLQGPLALIIEDDEKLALIFTQAVKMAGFETLTIRDGQEAAEQLGKVEPTLIVLDLHLPNVPGDRILDQIRHDPRLGKTRVILATADPRLADTLENHSDLVLLKPISFDQLRDLAARIKSSFNA